MILGSEPAESGEDGKEGWEGEREGEIPPLITSWVTAPAGRCQNPTLSDVKTAPENGEGLEEARKEYEENGSVMRIGRGMRHFLEENKIGEKNKAG